MSISSSTRTAGPFTGAGTVSMFPFTFKVFTADDIYVGQRDDSTLAVTELVNGVDFTLSLNADQDDNPGGSISLTAGMLATGQTLYITSDVDYTQEVDIHNRGGFYPSVINKGLDRVVILIQQLKTQVDLAVKMSAFDTSGDVDEFIAGLMLAYQNVNDIILIAEHILDVIATGEDLRGDDNIGTVATNIADVNTVVVNIASVATVAAGMTNIDAVADWLDAGGSAALGVTYDNSTSGLAATNVQDAIDEIATLLAAL